MPFFLSDIFYIPTDLYIPGANFPIKKWNVPEKSTYDKGQLILK